MDERRKKILGSLEIPKAIADDLKKTLNVSGFSNKIKERAQENTTNLLDVILAGAIKLNASDIHIEPAEEKTILRVRLDGILQDVVFFSNEIYHTLLSRIKLLSKIKLNIQDSPQDGRFTIMEEGFLIEVRTSTLPAEYGESIVMRILNPKNLLNLENLGLRKDLYEIFNSQIQKPNGMIIVTGPTGAGKTTTLYAFLMKAQNRGIEIITIEDPIEYHIEGILQTQVAPEKGYTFSEGLRSIVRQDPDVILVGEVRDAETAKIALQSSLTGHLVFSTLHTNDAAGTIARLVDLDSSLSSIASALKMVVAQRLVRKVCKECSQLTKPSEPELAEIKSGLRGIKIAEIPKDFSKVKFAKVNQKGCSRCNFTGYRGRKGLLEVFLVDAQMEKLILKNPAVSQIKELLAKGGMITMYQSGLIEVVLGQTTLEEVKKVVEAD